MSSFDLTRHGVFEASAGTGKTWTIEQLVLALVSAGVPLDQILLVTYTEKAAGELKGRLRERLAKELDADTDRRDLLQKALDSFDQAQVSTIHGFCHRVLQEFAFENRQDFQSRLVHDCELLQPCLREIQRRHWPDEYGELLPTLLELADYNKDGVGGQQWEQLVCRVAADFRPGCNHILLPQIADDWRDRLRDLEDQVRRDLVQWRQLAGPIDFNRVDLHPWHRGYAAIHPARLNTYLRPILLWLADPRTEPRPLPGLRRLTGLLPKTGFLFLMPKKHRKQMARACPNLETVLNGLQAYVSTDYSDFEKVLAVRTIGQLQAQLTELKRQRGQQSFEDMLTRLDDALDPERNGSAATLQALLRGRFRHAIVDEFQDTDPIQWRILQRLFVGGGPQRLIVVGDPKQAIFGFRGADLQTYLEAVSALRDRCGAQVQTLAINWRSSPELLRALNHLFKEGNWFRGRLTYTPVDPPEEAQRRHRLARDETGRAALTIVDVGSEAPLTKIRRHYARFVAGEISRLLGRGGSPRLEISLDKREPRPLDAGDIAVLVFKRPEAQPIIDELRKARIPYSLYKQPGLWESDEAIHLAYVLKALARPGDVSSFYKALLTRFYRIKPKALAACGELPANHAVRELFDRWRSLADKRAWAELFQSLLEESGILWYKRKSAEADRRRANLRHITRELEQAAYGQDLDLLGVVDAFAELRRRRGEEETDLQPIETQRPKVRILTIHACKGLEYPVVFLAGGFTAGRGADCHTYRLDGQLFFDLRKSGQASSQAGRDEEERRLLYVALTRAMFKLYVPQIVPPEGQSYSHQGPVATILADALTQARPHELGPPDAELLAVDDSAAPSEPAGLAALAPRLDEPFEPPEELFPVIDPKLKQRRIRIRSFSSLHRESAPETPSYIDWLARAQEEEPAPAVEEDPFRGTAFGEMVHDTLERIDFASVGAATEWGALVADRQPTQALIVDQVGRHWAKLPVRIVRQPERKEQCRDQVARLVWLALHTPLEAAGGPLWQLSPADRLHELEFAFPELEVSIDRTSDGPAGPPPEVRLQEGFLAGLMDLVFRKDGKYFLLDWKTNDLHGRYSAADLEQSMAEHDYVRQYRLYLHALARWLRRLHGPDFDFERDFGGVYYLFLRGLNGRDESTGVFFRKPTALDLRLELVLNS